MKILTIIGTFILLLSAGCGKQSAPIAQGWSAPVKITDTQDSLIGSVVLRKLHDAIIAFQPQEDGMAKCFVLNSDSKSWAEVSLAGVPRGYFWWWPAIEQGSDKVFFERGYIENDKLVMSALIGRMTVNTNLLMKEVVENTWLTSVESLFEKMGSIVHLSESGGRDWPELGVGIINNSDMYIPCSISGITYNRVGPVARGPYMNGVFHSVDSGKTWKLENILDFYAEAPSICRSGNNYYYFVANPSHQLLVSKKIVTGCAWSSVEQVTTNFGGHYVLAPQSNVVHLCWLDNRHEKKQLDIGVFPPHLYRSFQNCEIVYRQHKDSDNKWGNEVILSEGLLYAFSPSMSVEGDRIVIAWAGVRTGNVWHSTSDPNDIYYVTSKDGGKSWMEPQRITDNIKAEITAGNPQVVLQNGIIHLTYTQGKLKLKQDSPGLTKLNQPPWPIYYQQRPFPN